MPEGKKEKQDEKKPGQTPEALPKPAGQSAMSEKSREDFEDKKQAMVDEADAAFEKHISAGSPNLDEKALSRLRDIKERQKKAIAELFEERRKNYEQRAGSASADREALAAELISTSTEEARQKIRLLERVIKAKKNAEYITTDEVYAIEMAINGVENYLKADKKLQEIAGKLAEGGEPSPQEYTYIITYLSPFNFQEQRSDVKKTFEATSAGVLIGLMKPVQRVKLIELVMDSDKRNQTVPLIDAMMKTGNINREQGESLFMEAIAKGILTQDQYNKDFRAKVEQGHYQQEAEQYRKIVEDELNRNYRGKFSENILKRTMGAPALGGAAALWGFVLTVLNVWATLANKDDPNKLQTLLSNPYIYAGMGAMAVGSEVATSGMKKGAGVVGGGVVSRELDTIGENPEAEIKKRAHSQIEQIILNSPKELSSYLTGGGFGTLIALKRDKATRNEKPIITVDELYKFEKDQARKIQLQNLKKMPFVSEDTISMNLTMIGESTLVLGIETDESFNKLVEDIRKNQKQPGQKEAAPEATKSTQA